MTDFSSPPIRHVVQPDPEPFPDRDNVVPIQRRTRPTQLATPRTNGIAPGCKAAPSCGLPNPIRLRAADDPAPRARKQRGNPARHRIELALEREGELWKKMAAAYRAGRWELLRRLIKVYITSFDVRLAHAHRANQKRKKHRRLPDRQLLTIAHEVDLLRPCAEPVRTFREPKDGGGFREITVPGIVNKARSKMLCSILKLARDRSPGNAYYTGNGGGKAAIRKVVKIVADPARKWLDENDIVNFFGSFDEAAVVAMLCEILPIDPRAVKYTALASQLNYPGGTRRGRTGGRSNFRGMRKRPHNKQTRRQAQLAQHPGGSPHHGHACSTTVVPTVGKGRCGLPQGFPASPIIAELLVAPSLADHGVVYADNVFDAFATVAEVRENNEALVAVLRDHRAGPFTLKPPVIRRLDWGADVLGTRIKKKQGRVTTGPTKAALARFYKETWTDPATTRRAGGKVNMPKLKKRVAGMTKAMPLDDEGRWWLEVVAESRLGRMVKVPHERVRPRSRLMRGQDYLDMYCGFCA